MFNVLPSSYKPMPSPGIFGNSNFAPSQKPSSVQQQQQHHQQHQQHQQRVSPVKELQPIAKVPQQFSPEYRPETVGLSAHRGGFDDDRGPIHTIPAPNLGPASKSYQLQQQQQHQQQQQFFGGQESQGEEVANRPPYSVTQVDYSTIFGGQGESRKLFHEITFLLALLLCETQLLSNPIFDLSFERATPHFCRREAD